ncbi:DUF488 domain-containing protein [Lysobacter sp. TY2-98]|uniref:DUF488 domain-containing protein n=1 Tax=Lysobacter sp. TY2-98 TaxID=2290922 RepID=UPI000E20A8A3|nr:DUF488 domain-containing protein [Lysobacter sp. TY2-98]AXK71606.1 DUF488 domain-containing protein [Lysobacter sp. TY2-98]
MDDRRTLWTVGHSTHPWDAFVALLHQAGIEAVADVRRFTGSRRHPQFNDEAMARALAAIGIDYVPFRDLGGRRRPRPDTHNAAWRNEAFRGYADYLETDEYRHAAERLSGLAALKVTTVMCAEAMWWQCHRALISDDFKSRGWTVLHLQPGGRVQEHPYTAAARIVDGRLTYSEPQVQGGLF